jgi:hypothetical protein
MVIASSGAGLTKQRINHHSTRHKDSRLALTLTRHHHLHCLPSAAVFDAREPHNEKSFFQIGAARHPARKQSLLPSIRDQPLGHCFHCFNMIPRTILLNIDR